MIQISGSQLVSYTEAAWKAGEIERIPELNDTIVKVDYIIWVLSGRTGRAINLAN